MIPTSEHDLETGTEHPEGIPDENDFVYNENGLDQDGFDLKEFCDSASRKNEDSVSLKMVVEADVHFVSERSSNAEKIQRELEERPVAGNIENTCDEDEIIMV